jgi:hypothetical protein
MANEEHLSILKSGLPQWKQWRRDSPDIRPDLSGADLKGMNLEGVHFGSRICTKTRMGFWWRSRTRWPAPQRQE